MFADVRDKVGKEVVRIQKTAKAIAALDVFASLALVAERNNFVRPKINENGVLDIKNGRHPVVEQMIENDMFIANDTYLDNQKKRVSIITGPNMAGKSTHREYLLAHLKQNMPDYTDLSVFSVLHYVQI